jgi:hypothetical protein
MKTEGLAMHYAHALTQRNVPELISASFVGDVIRMQVREADFTVRLSGNPLQAMTLEFTAVFRECDDQDKPGGTWWNSWTIEAAGASCDTDRVGELLWTELAESRRKFARALSDTRRPREATAMPAAAAPAGAAER